MIDYAVCAQFTAALQFSVAACGGDDQRTAQFGDLNGCAADAAASTHNQRPFARLQLRAGNQHMPRRQEHQWERCCFLEVEVCGLVQQVALRHDDILGVAARAVGADNFHLHAQVLAPHLAESALTAGDNRVEDHFVALAPVTHALTDLHNLACDIAAENVR
jgi:hypothetical protein